MHGTRLLSALPSGLLLALSCLFSVPALAAEPIEEIITAARGDYQISGLVTRLPGATKFRHGIVQFPGNPSIMRLRMENGQPVFGLTGNTLVRSRQLWLADDTLVVTADAPSDYWGSFRHELRRAPRYGEDIAALLAAVAARYPVAEWTLVGHSEGAISAYGAAMGTLQTTQRVVMISSVFVPTRNGAGLTRLDWEPLKGRLLWVHHANDPCQYTPYYEAERYAHKTEAPLLTVHGVGETRGEACQAFTEHGLVGMEKPTIEAIQGWIRSGKVPVSIGK